MKILSMLAAVGLCTSVCAQSSLACTPSWPVAYFFGFTAPTNDTNIYFNLTVSSAITLQAIETPLLSALGQRGTLSLYTCPTTHVGNELNAAAWTLAATGVITGRGSVGSAAVLTARSCQESAATPGTGLTLLPGSYGIAVRYQGVTPLLTQVSALQTFSNAELSVSSGALQQTAFTSALQASSPTFAGWSFHGSIFYGVGAGAAHTCAEPFAYGDGCYTRCGSFYQLFTDGNPPAAAAASAAMSGRRLTLDPFGSSYRVRQGTVAFLPPTGAANLLPHGDDTELAVPLPLPFAYPGGIATTFFVHANGYISVASNAVLPGAMIVSPTVAAFLNAPAAGWWSWHNYDPSEPGSGQVTWEQVGANLLVFTWSSVESKPSGVVNPSTFQFQFDVVTGQVHYVWQTIDAIGSTGLLQADDHLVGYSPGGPSQSCGVVDITTLTGVLLQEPEVAPLALTAAGRPVIGTTISLVTSNPTTPFGIGINFLTTSRIPLPGLDLGLLGAAGCRAHVDISTGVGNAISNAGLAGLTMSLPLPVPNNPLLMGLEIFSQSVWMDPLQNAAGLVTSNGLELTLGTF